MTNCTKCSTSIGEGMSFCPSCGESVNTTANVYSADSQTSQGNAFEEKFGKLNETNDETAGFTAADIESNRIMAVLAYIFFFIPLLAAKDSPFARYHANQGLVLFLGAILCSLIVVIPILGWIIAPILSVVITVFAVIGIINALNGKAKELPIIGKFRILK